ncbi:MAG: hypothetical protein F4234_05285 [Gammaproteobacteria bacterium]|nr:hypothetical protein [Gammaproteobacteria bacterium]
MTGQVPALKRFPTFVLAGLLSALTANPAVAAGLGALDQDDRPDGQLSLVAQESGDGLPGGNDALDGRIAELENRLALAREEADRVRIEQEELRARLDDLDDQIAIARQIMELQERELAQLQASLAAQAEEEARQEAERAAAAAAEAEVEARAAAEFPQNLLESPVLLAIGAAVLVLTLAVGLISRGGRRRDYEQEETFVMVPGATERDEAGSTPDTGCNGRHEEEEFTPEPGQEAVDDSFAEERPDGERQAERGADLSVEAESGAGPEAVEVQTDEEDGSDMEFDRTGEEEITEEEIAEQLNLAYSLYKMGDKAGARESLERVIAVGNEEQVREARKLLLLVIVNDME